MFFLVDLDSASTVLHFNVFLGFFFCENTQIWHILIKKKRLEIVTILKLLQSATPKYYFLAGS